MPDITIARDDQAFMAHTLFWLCAGIIIGAALVLRAGKPRKEV